MKEATKRLKGRSISKRFKAIYEVYLTFKYLLSHFKRLVKGFAKVNFNKANALKDYVKINVTAAYKKLFKYYKLLNAMLAYYTTTLFYPYYKYYFVNAWTGVYKSWRDSADAQF